MSESLKLEAVRERVSAFLVSRFGRVEENLVGSGIIDSLKAIGVALALEEEFGVPLENLSVSDMATLSSLTRKVHDLTQKGAPRAVCCGGAAHESA
jgi:acyl carrier protein